MNRFCWLTPGLKHMSCGVDSLESPTGSVCVISGLRFDTSIHMFPLLLPTPGYLADCRQGPAGRRYAQDRMLGHRASEPTPDLMNPPQAATGSEPSTSVG